MKRYFILALSFSPAFVWFALLIFLSGQNGEETAELSSEIAEWFQKYLFPKFEDQTIHMVLRKVAHAFVYAVEALLLVAPLTKYMSMKRSMLLTLALCSVVAILDEVFKAYIPGRHCDWPEILLNIMGVSIGIGVGGILSLFVRAKRNRWQKTGKRIKT